MNEETDCRHAVGTAVVEYSAEMFHVGDGYLEDLHAFQAFSFCPYCGKDISVEAEEFNQQIQAAHLNRILEFDKPHIP